MKKLIVCIVLFFSMILVQAQSFNDVFEDATLRMDLILAGNNKQTQVYLDEYAKLNGWAGRRAHCADFNNLGNAKATLRDATTNEILYVTSFSMLYMEWQRTEEATKVNKAFQQVVLLPYPKSKATITIEFRNYDGVFEKKLVAPVDPKDILIRKKENMGNKVQSILKSGTSAECVDIVFVAEGYAQNEQEKFFNDARRLSNYLFQHNPFNELKEQFNISAVGVVSKESGHTAPSEGVWKNTAMDAHYDTFYSNRYLMTNKLKKANDYVADVPYEQLIILVNTERYGGGGIFNSHTLITADNDLTNIILVHEFGHAFAGLADEYFYPNDPMENFYNKKVEPWEPNITTLVDFDSKWKDMLPKNAAIPSKQVDTKKVGVYEGGGYAFKGIYRPMDDCRMRSNKPDSFCPVCARAIKNVTKFLTEK